MKTGILIFLSTLLFNTTDPLVKSNEKEEVSKTNIELEIELFNEIIEAKLDEANVLEEKAKILLAEDSNSEAGAKSMDQAKLARMMTLKYRAAIACRNNLQKQ